MTRTLTLFEVLLSTLEDPNSTGQMAMSNAYEASLASIHPWILKKSLMAAFKIAPTREAFFQQLAPSDEVALACMRRFITANRPIVQSVTDTFEKFNLKWTF